MSNQDQDQNWRASDEPLTELEIAFQNREKRKAETENLSTTSYLEQTEPDFTDSEPEGEEDSYVQENKPLFTDSESEDEDRKSVPLTERSKKLPFSETISSPSTNLKSPNQAINFDRIMNQSNENN